MFVSYLSRPIICSLYGGERDEELLSDCHPSFLKEASETPSLFLDASSTFS